MRTRLREQVGRLSVALAVALIGVGPAAAAPDEDGGPDDDIAADAGAVRGSPDNAGPLPDIPEFDDSFEEGLVEHSWAEGLSIDFGLRSTAFLATDCCRLRGIGGAASLRVSTWLDSRLRWVLRFDVAGIPARKLEEMSSGDDGDDVTLNQQSAVTLGVQMLSLGPVWLEAGLGFANYSLRSADQTVPETNRDGSGFALVSAVGTEVYRAGRLRVAVEFTFLGSLYTRIDDQRASGFIGQLGFGLSTSFH